MRGEQSPVAPVTECCTHLAELPFAAARSPKERQDEEPRRTVPAAQTPKPEHYRRTCASDATHASEQDVELGEGAEVGRMGRGGRTAGANGQAGAVEQGE